MKKIYIMSLIVLTILFSSIHMNCLAQGSYTNTIVKLAPGVINPFVYIKYNQPISPQILVECHAANIPVLVWPNPQSEVHLSINKQNPQVILLSANTFPINNSGQGAYWSVNGGTVWVGSDNLPNGAFGRGDPSTAFDAAGNGFVSTLNAVNLVAPTANGAFMQTTNKKRKLSILPERQ